MGDWMLHASYLCVLNSISKISASVLTTIESMQADFSATGQTLIRKVCYSQDKSFVNLKDFNNLKLSSENILFLLIHCFIWMGSVGLRNHERRAYFHLAFASPSLLVRNLSFVILFDSIIFLLLKWRVKEQELIKKVNMVSEKCRCCFANSFMQVPVTLTVISKIKFVK